MIEEKNMIIKKIAHPYQNQEIHEEAVVLILGFFDGVHLGHQAVIKKGVEIARKKGIKSAFMTFNRHPYVVYRKFDAAEYYYLTSNTQKQSLVAKLGVDLYYEVEFTSAFGSLSPQDFVDQYIVSWHADTVVTGFDYTYGKPDIANVKRLDDYGRGRFDIVTISEQTLNGIRISSTKIRESIKSGAVSKANLLLGYPYYNTGFVVHGEGRGRDLGYPTANIFMNPQELVPGIGVYAVQVKLNKQIYNGMASVGYNVTFEPLNRPSIEVNIFDFDQSIYGENIKIFWHEFIRDEEKFDSVTDLVEQLQQDEQNIRNILKEI